MVALVKQLKERGKEGGSKEERKNSMTIEADRDSQRGEERQRERVNAITDLSCLHISPYSCFCVRLRVVYDANGSRIDFLTDALR